MMALIRSERNKLLTVDELHEIIQSISNDNISGEDKLWKPKGGQVLAMSVNPDSDPGELIADSLYAYNVTIVSHCIAAHVAS